MIHPLHSCPSAETSAQKLSLANTREWQGHLAMETQKGSGAPPTVRTWRSASQLTLATSTLEAYRSGDIEK